MDTGDLPEIDPVDLVVRRKAGDVVLLDVREPFELEICCFDEAVAIPLAALPERLDNLPRNQPLIVICHHGQRSHLAARYLRRNGFDAINLRGGMHAWSTDVDPTMRRY